MSKPGPFSLPSCPLNATLWPSMDRQREGAGKLFKPAPRLIGVSDFMPEDTLSENPFWSWLNAKGLAPHGGYPFYNPSLLWKVFKNWRSEQMVSTIGDSDSVRFYNQVVSHSQEVARKERYARELAKIMTRKQAVRESRELMEVYDETAVVDGSLDSRSQR